MKIAIKDDIFEFKHIKRGCLTVQDAKEMSNVVFPIFNCKKYDPLSIRKDLHDFETYQLRNKEELISSLSIEHCKVKFEETEKDILVLYNIITVEKFRRKGYAKKLIKSSIDHYIIYKNLKVKKIMEFADEKNVDTNDLNLINLEHNSYNFKEDNIKDLDYISSSDLLITLQIDPFDKEAAINYAFYISLGFEKARLSHNSNVDFINCLSCLNSLDDVRETTANIFKRYNCGRYFTMFCRYEYLMQKKMDVSIEIINEGKTLINYLRKYLYIKKIIFRMLIIFFVVLFTYVLK